ncbi:hypothetical protein EYZ11_008467 [Aspergillus tanneri]|uniref:Metallo-beta-lactamase domain-containing protein n=1 Tax=Aspergillus tanneri TaxID=1220188 RepID=A0A4S3JAC9_9EURO|nr:uncharacterized protein ATNIH1004_005251 [Aspergillus tanneri]KAA8649350.1 hypothetical protein ATNIH1004_005251 [Aspergillus tanneri]THC92059.1 hypothetical protein EYZ11_008467 [Aspergillus tanneri]
MILPPARPNQSYVSVSAIPAGLITAPKWAFVEGVTNREETMPLPCMAFLITRQPTSDTDRVQRASHILFDLGLRETPENYTPAQQSHLQHRQPVTFGPSVRRSLSAAGIPNTRVDLVIYSHVHWDHTGEPSEFPHASFVVGHGSLDLLSQGELLGAGSHACFDRVLLQDRHVVELPPSDDSVRADITDSRLTWGPLTPFPAAMDIFQDGSVYVIPSPGHLQGHVNLLCRTGPRRWVYLGGDTYHHVGLLTGEERIATWTDDQGRTLCVHTDQKAAEEMFALLRNLQLAAEEDGVELELITSHDAKWFSDNQHRLFPKTLERSDKL